MAAVDLLRTPLPKPWSYGVTRDGRVFFVDDERRVTSWLHPVLGIAVQSGYNYTQDLPAGFEEGVTAEGVPYYVDHFHQTTSFHPPETRELHHTPVASHDTDSKSSNDSRKSGNKKKHTKQRILDKTPLAKRSPNSPVAKRGWLYHQEGAGLKTWKRRWCVLSDFCLFIYKNSEEDKLVESILLPSYKVSQCGVDDSVKREFAFKVEHENVRTYYLATDNKDSMASWMNVMGLATVLERDPSIEEQIRRHKSLTGEDDEGGFSDSRTRYPDAIPSDQSRYPDTLASDQSRYPDNLASDQVRYSDTLPSDVSRYPDPYPHDLGHYNDRRPENLFESYTSPEQDSLRESHRNAGYPGYSPNMSAPLREINNQDSVRSGNYGQERREEPVYQNVPQRNHLNTSYPQQEAYKSQGHSPRSDLMNSHQSLASTPSNTPNQLTDDAKDYGKLRRGDANWDISDYENRFGKHNLQSGVPEQTSKISPYADQPGLLGYRESYHDSYTSLENKENVHSNNAANRNDSLQRLQEWKQRMQRLSTSSIQSNNTTPRNRTQDRSPEQQALTVDTSSSPANHSPRYDQRQYSRNQNEADVPEARRGISASLDHLYPQDRYGSQDRFYSPGQYGSQQLGDYSAGRHGSQERLSDRNVSGTSHDDSFGPAPERPPLPAAYREQIALEMAATKTPASKQDLLLGVAGSRVRQNEPIFFQFPESPPFDGNQHQDQQLSARSQQTADSNVAHQRESMYPDSYQRARQQAETQWKADNTQQPTYPQSYLRAKYDDETHRQKASPSGHNGYPESYWNAYNSEHPDGGKYFEQQGLDRNQSGDHSYRDPAGNGSFQSPEGQSHQQGGTRPSPSQNSHHGAGQQASPRTNRDTKSHFIYTLKEDPDMSDSDILATRTFQNLQKTLNGHLRLSISAGDLIGKSHEELVLLLIQLRRQQAMLETAQAQCKQRLDEMRDTEKTYRRVRHNSVGALPDAMESEHSQYTELVNENSELLKKLEVFKPLVNLVDNLVTMGSLYGGDNLMLASQFKQHKLRPGQYTPPKKLVEFSRHLQEQKLAETHKHELQQLTEEEMDFEEKLQKLIELDRTLQDHSVAVASLQDDRDMLEKALSGLSKELDRAQYEGDSRLCDQLLQQQRTMEKEMSKVRLQLAEQSRILEEIATENARVEHEVMLLRKRVSGHLNRSISSPTLSSESARAKSRLERELSSIQSIMDGLNQQGAKLSEVMSTLRRSNPDLTESQPVKQTTYIETDMDTMESMDMANRQSLPRGGSTYSTPNKGMTRSSPQTHLPSSGRQLYQPVPAGGDLDSPTSYSHSRQQSYGFVVEENERVPTTEMLQHSFQPFRRDHDNASDTRPQQQSFQPIESSFQPVGQTSYQSLDRSARQTSHQSLDYPDRSAGQTSYQSLDYPDRSAGQTSYQSLDHPDRSAGQSYQSLGHPDQSAGQTSYQSLGHIYDKSPDTHGQSSPDAWTSADISMATESDGFSPRDISEADDNTKRFYGLLPKEKPKYQTVRDIKKRETERRSRDRRRPLGEGNGDGSEAYMSDASVRGPEISAVRRSQSLPRNLSKADEPSRGPAPSSYTTRQPLQRDSYVRHSDRTSDRKPRPLASGSLRASTSRLPRKKRLSEISSKSAVERLYPHRNSVSQSESSMRSESENTHNASPYSPMSSESRDVADGQSSAAVSRVSLKDTDRFRDLLDTESSPMMTSSPHSTLTRNKATESPGNLGSSPLSQKLGSQSSFSGNFTKLHQGAPVGKVRPVLSSQESFLVRAQPAMVTSNVSYDVRDYDDLMRGQSSAIQSSRDKESQSHHSRDQSILSADLNSIARDHMYMPEKLSPRPSSVSPSHNASLSPGRVKTEHSSLTDDTKSSLSLQEDSKPSPHLSPRRQAFLEARKHTRGRFLTVSSSQPVTLEQHFDHRAKVQSAAGDLILPRSQEATIKTAEIMMTNFDEQTIDREVLHLPEKVEIPERYSPDSEDDADLSQEEQIERQKKAQRIKKMLAVHSSLQEFSSEELHVRQGRVHQALEHEKKEREHVLDIRQALALEAKSKTRELAAQRRKTWSSETPGRHVEGAEDDGYNTMRSNADSSALYT